MRKKPTTPPKTDRPCAVEHCAEAGEYKAPLSRDRANEYQYLCLKHVQEFNKAWDYFSGWSRKDIEDFMDASAHGHQPTWSMEERLGAARIFFMDADLRSRFADVFGHNTHTKKQDNTKDTLPTKIIEAFSTLELEVHTQLDIIKKHYKMLVKKYHPDINRDDTLAEEKFKQVTAAYNILMKHYS